MARTDLHTALSGSVADVAPRLLGSVLRHAGVAVRLTEVEAYGGSDDPGSHGFRGRTRRNATMFGPPGHLYCYFSYGMHVCANVATGPDGTAAAVLLRAGEVVEGLDVARQRRPGVADRDLARGPACLSRALAIDLTRDGDDVVAGPVTLDLPHHGRTLPVSTGPRVGLRGAPDRPWRFWLSEEPTVSRYRAATAAGRPTPR